MRWLRIASAVLIVALSLYAAFWAYGLILPGYAYLLGGSVFLGWLIAAGLLLLSGGRPAIAASASSGVGVGIAFLALETGMRWLAIGASTAWLVLTAVVLFLAWRRQGAATFKAAATTCLVSIAFGVSWFSFAAPFAKACLDSQAAWDPAAGRQRQFWCPPPERDGHCRAVFGWTEHFDSKDACRAMWSAAGRR